MIGAKTADPSTSAPPATLAHKLTRIISARRASGGSSDHSPKLSASTTDKNGRNNAAVDNGNRVVVHHAEPEQTAADSARGR